MNDKADSESSRRKDAGLAELNLGRPTKKFGNLRSQNVNLLSAGLISIALLIIVSQFIGCANKQDVVNNLKHSQNSFFENKKGCFLLYNLKTNSLEKVVGDELCNERLPPCSTFKVPLAAIAFDSRLLKDEHQILKWDGKNHDREVSHQDHNAKTWMRDSIVWFSQRLTLKLGKEKLQKYLNTFEYGNKDLNGGLTQAWLVPPSSMSAALKISAYEQLDFMKKLWTNSLPVSKKSMHLTQDITYLETSPNGFRLSGKTGSNFYDTNKKIHFGWFISHLKNKDQEYIAITHMSDLSPSDEPGFGGSKAKEITKNYLRAYGLW